MTEPYDSRPDTQAHIRRVYDLLRECMSSLHRRGVDHDASKLIEPEKSMFDEYTPRLRDSEYGTPEYAETLKAMGAALQHHYQHNSHHPEYWPIPDTDETRRLGRVRMLLELIDAPGARGQRLRTWEATHDTALYCVQAQHDSECSPINGMSLLDMIELLADWKAATERHATGDLAKSLQHNRTRYALSSQVYNLLRNTAIELGWINDTAPATGETTRLEPEGDRVGNRPKKRR